MDKQLRNLYTLAISSAVVLLLLFIIPTTRISIFSAFQDAFAFIMTYWAEILVFTLLVAVVVWLLLGIFSKMLLKRVKEEHDRIREKSEIQKMRYGLRRQ